MFSKCHQTLKQISMGSPLGAATCISLPQGAASRIPIMERDCAYGSVIHSNEWPACSNLNQLLLEKFSLEGLASTPWRTSILL